MAQKSLGDEKRRKNGDTKSVKMTEREKNKTLGKQ